MTVKELYLLIHGLSSEEKARVSRFLASIKGGGRPAYFMLFEVICDISEWNSETEELLKSKFKRSDTFYQARENLLDKIIQALSDPFGDLPRRKYILKSIELNVIHLAKRAMKRAVENSLEAKAFFDALQYLRLNQEVFEIYNQRLFLDQEGMVLERVKRACDSELELGDLYQRLKSFVRIGYTEWKTLAIEMFDLLEQVSTHSVKQSFQKERIKSRLLFFRGEFLQAISNQEKLIREFEDNDISNGLWMQEISFLVQLYGDNNEEEKAAYWTFKLGQIDIGSEMEKRLLGKMWVKNAVLISDKFFRFDLSSKAIEMMGTYGEIIKPEYQATYLHSAILVAFANGQFERSMELIDRVRKIPKRERSHISWQPYVLKVLILHAMGEDLEAAMKSASRFLKKQSRRFPWLLIRIAKEAIRNPQSIKREWINKWESEIEATLSTPEEVECSYYFDVHLWLYSLSSKRTMAEEAKRKEKSVLEFPNSVGFV